MAMYSKELDKWAENFYRGMKNGVNVVKISDSLYTCPFCYPYGERNYHQLDDLQKHASRIRGDSHYVREKAAHIALERYMRKYLCPRERPGPPPTSHLYSLPKEEFTKKRKCTSLQSIEDFSSLHISEGNSSSSNRVKTKRDYLSAGVKEREEPVPQFGLSHGAPQYLDSLSAGNGDQMFVHPWKGILANIKRTKDENTGKYAGESGDKIRDLLVNKGVNPRKVTTLWESEIGFTGFAFVDFGEELEGFRDAIIFDKHFQVNRHGKKDYERRRSDRGDKLYGWVANQDDYYSGYFISEHLKKKGELRSLSSKEAEYQRTAWMQTKYKEPSSALEKAMREKDETKEKEEKEKAQDVATATGEKKILKQMQRKDEEEKKTSKDQISLRQKHGRECYNRSITSNKEASKPEQEDEEQEDMTIRPFKRYKRRSGERRRENTVCNNASTSFTGCMSKEPEEAPPKLILSAAPIQDEKDSKDSAVIVLNDEPITDPKPDTGNCSAPMFEMDECSTHVEERDRETEENVNDTTAMDVPPSDVGKSSENKVADVSLELASSTSSNGFDITCGAEYFGRIPWVNEINGEVPSHFRYISESVVFQDASVKFSHSSFSDEQSCSSSCIGDCLASAIQCNCANSGFAYTAGVIGDEFLEARISEVRDISKQVVHFCKECPLQRAKKEDVVQPCKGHLRRQGIKECWIKCGCTRSCVNRVTQRGICYRLEVFFTENGKGWGLRTLEKLPKGAFVCEYIGEILTIQEFYQRRFEDKLTCPVILDAFWGSEELLEDDRVLCLDGTCYGNIARFLNHRCTDANLIEIPVHVDTPDQHYYHLAFFTTRDIEAREELTWDYGKESLMKSFDCMCDSKDCRDKKTK